MSNLARRLSKLEGLEPQRDYGAYILYAPHLQSEEDAIAEHEAKYGPIEGEVFFIQLVGVNPD